MSWAHQSPRGSKKGNGGGVAWAAATSAMLPPPPPTVPVAAPYSSNGISPFSSNSSGVDRQRTLDMDPEAVSHVRSMINGGL